MLLAEAYNLSPCTLVPCCHSYSKTRDTENVSLEASAIMWSYLQDNQDSSQQSLAMDLNSVERKPVTLVISYSSQKSSSHNRFDWVQTMLHTYLASFQE